MFAMVCFTFFILLLLFKTRAGLARKGEIDLAYFGTYQQGSEPENSAKLARHFSNIFETPTLFYAACLAGIAINATTPLLVASAWVYVALRVVHAWIHTGQNKLQPRIAAYFTSWIVLLAMWIQVIVAAGASSGA